MGIKGLWRALKPYVRDGHLGQFRGQRVAVDMYVWLHQSVRGCITINYDILIAYLEAKHVRHDKQASIALEDLVVVSSRYIDFIVNKIDALQRFGVTPVCVFDGAEMPMKRGTDADRQQRRDTCFREALTLLDTLYTRTQQGSSHGAQALDRHSPAFGEAVQLLERAVDISTELAHAVLQVLREERHVECIVAPYEADAELSYLCREGYVQAVISEDSDLLAYFCPRVIAKLDAFSGRCEVLVTSECAPCFFADMAATSLRKKPVAAGQLNKGTASKDATGQDTALAIDTTDGTNNSTSGSGSSSSSGSSGSNAESAQKFTYESFLLGCVMSGCDYVPNLRSIGVKTAFKLVAQAHSLPHLLQLLEVNYGFGAEEMKRYQRQLLAAFYCFAHHIVYCPRRKEMVHYHPLPPAIEGTTHTSAKQPNTLSSSTTTNSSNSLTGRTELIGERWPATLAQKVCEDCQLDPCTHELYKGQYQHCLRDYLQRTRRGQTSLKQFAGFERQEVSKVVVRLSSAAAQTARQGVNRLLEKSALFRSPLAKVREGSGYCGANAATLTTVRSKYFALASFAALEAEGDESTTSLDSTTSPGEEPSHVKTKKKIKKEENGGVVHTSENTSSSSTTLDEETYDTCMSPPMPLATDTIGATASHVDNNTNKDSSSLGSSSSSSSSSLPAGVHGLSRHHRRTSQQQQQKQQRVLLGVEEEGVLVDATETVVVEDDDNDADEPHTAVVESEAQGETCACPFGYWQCNKAHSIFEQCFAGKDWVRGEGKTFSHTTKAEKNDKKAASLQLPSSPSSTIHCIGRFRPPQSRKRERTEATDAEEESADDVTSRAQQKRRVRAEDEAVDVDEEGEEEGDETSTADVARACKTIQRPFRPPRPAPSATEEGRGRRGEQIDASDEANTTEDVSTGPGSDGVADVFARYMFVARKSR